jgi:phosphoserine phosphatase RsbU/P
MRSHALRRRIEHEAQDAWSVQRSFLPAECPLVPGYQFWHDYKPARFVGGDYFDYQEVSGAKATTSGLSDGRWAVTLGDVSGKGMPAALLMARVAAEVRLLLQKDSDPSPIAGILSKNFYDSGMPDRFMTLLLSLNSGNRLIKGSSCPRPWHGKLDHG